MSDSTLERIIPNEIAEGDDTGRATLVLHLQRYEFASKFIARDARVLDIACGVGYGTRLMADMSPEAGEFVGVDISADSIEYATEHYGDDRIEYCVADAMSYRCSDKFDVIVSLETIEHLKAPAEFLTNVLLSLKPGGVFIASVPTTPSVDGNPHHLHDFTKRSFRAMLSERNLSEIDAFEQIQPYSFSSVVSKSEKRLVDRRENLIGYYVRHPGAFFKRIVSLMVDGTNNKYLTVAAQSPSGQQSV